MVTIPDHLTDQEAEQIVRESETLLQVTQKARCNRKQAKRMVRHFSDYDSMKTGADMIAAGEIDTAPKHPNHYANR